MTVALLGCGPVAVGSEPDADGRGEAADDGGSDGGEAERVPCPDEVPDKYQLLWDCGARACEDDQRKVYHEATGSSTTDGAIEAEEHWFMFWNGGDDWCMDTMSLAGGTTTHTVDEYNCATCEEIFEVVIDVDAATCGVHWGSVFNDETAASGPYDAFLMFDTHTSFGDRNPGDAMLTNLVAVNWEDESTLADPGYARGTATPSSEADGPPEDYVWSNSGFCVTVQ